MTENIKRLIIADDHPIICEGIRTLLSEDPRFKLEGECGTAKELLESLKKEKWDLVILDISLPDKDGLTVLKQIKEEYPDLPVLILTMHSHQHFALLAFEYGASGYLTKECLSEELLLATKSALKGEKYISSSFGEKMIRAFCDGKPVESYGGLSKREFQVLIMIAQGKIMKEIAYELDVSIKTVSTYRSRLLDKLGMKSNADLIKYVIDKNLLP